MSRRGPLPSLIAVAGVVGVAVRRPIVLVVAAVVGAGVVVVAVRLHIVLVVVAVVVDVFGVVVVLFAFVHVAFVVIALAGVALYRWSFFGSGWCEINARHTRSASLVLSLPPSPQFQS